MFRRILSLQSSFANSPLRLLKSSPITRTSKSRGISVIKSSMQGIIHNLYNNNVRCFSQELKSFSFQENKPENLSLIQEVLTNLNLINSSVQGEKMDRDRLENIYQTTYNNVNSLEQNGKLEKGKKELITLLKILTQSSLTSLEKIIEVIQKIGGILEKLGEKQEALNYYQQTLLLQVNHSGEKSEISQRKLAQNYYLISNLLGELERYSEAQESIINALNIVLKFAGEEDLDTAQYVLTLGLWQSAQGELDEAVKNMNKAIEVQRNLLGEKSAVLGKSFMELGNVYQAWDKPLEALENYEECVEIFEEYPNGEFDEELASVWDSLADLSVQNEGWEEAIDYFNEAVDVRKRILTRLTGNKEEEHKEIAILYEKIAECYKEKGDFSQAKESYEKAINEYNQVYDEDNAEMIPFYQLYGYYASLEGSFAESMDYYKKALRIYTSNIEENNIEDDFEAIEMYKSIANVAFLDKNYNESIDYDMKVLDFYRRRKYMAKMEDISERIAKAYERMGNNEEAIKVYQRVLEEFLDYFGSDDSGVKKFYEALRDLYQIEERWEEITELDKFLEKYKEKEKPNVKLEMNNFDFEN